MLLTITNTAAPATDLGYLLHKHPARVQTFPLSFGRAHVFYPEASTERCTAALLLDVDPVGLVRGRGRASGDSLAEYVNDRPYVASSYLSVAIAEVFGTALAGRSSGRPELTETPLPLEAKLSVVPCRGGDGLLRRFFEPLGYTVRARKHGLDDQFPEWGEGSYFGVELAATVPLRALLRHLYVLVPVLDDEKHYWVGESEVDKLLRQGETWLAAHPEKELIAERYLRHFRRLTRTALARLVDEDSPDPDNAAEAHAIEEEAIERPVRLAEQRLSAILAELQACGPAAVLDLGCGEGRLLDLLLREQKFTRIAGMDVSYRALEIARERLRLDRLPPRQQERITLFQGSLSYRDARLEGFDAAVIAEVIEHLEPSRLAAFERVLFEYARPRTVLVTTPNVEYNVRFPDLPAGRLRHKDHRFEWTRAQFQIWADGVAARCGYRVRLLPVGPEDPDLGAPTQMAVFTSTAPRGGPDNGARHS